VIDVRSNGGKFSFGLAILMYMAVYLFIPM